MIWERTYLSDDMVVYDRHGINWFDAPTPKRWHRCKPWTVAFDRGSYVQRCACGSINVGGDRSGWMERNRRKAK